jgi:23S rRNA (adenine2503-C2)-methyltransferase
MSANAAWDEIRCLKSKDDNVLKYVFRRDDAVAESVLYKYPTYAERTVICCSTQSGCPVGCRFCGAGDYFVRSLSTEEIVSQPLYLLEERQIDGAAIKKLQIMFMSMGEPLLNWKQLAPALEELSGRYPNAALLISTSGPRVDYAPLRDLSARIPQIGLQFSVHESSDAARDLLIPFKAKLTLEGIAAEGRRWHEAAGRQPFFNYCAHEGNSSADDATRLADLFDPAVWQCTVSVVCEREESVAAANERQRELAGGFMQHMLARGYSARMFDPAGQSDVGGGCGQLWFVQQWMRDHPEQARPSAGRGLPVVHAPRLDKVRA